MILAGAGSAGSQELPEPYEAWYLHPVYTLGSRGSVPVNTNPWPLEQAFSQEEWPSVRLGGTLPGERYQNFFDPSGMSGKAVSIEMLLLDHVNKPVGCLLSARNAAEQPVWQLGYWDGKIFAGAVTQKDTGALGKKAPQGSLGKKAPRSALVQLEPGDEGWWKEHWLHLVFVVSGERLSIYVNGELRSQETIAPSPDPGSLKYELAAYLREEPYMELSNLLKVVRVFDKELSPAEITALRDDTRQMTNRGIFYPGKFHFVVAPYLHFPSGERMSLSWETSEPSRAVICYGKSLPLEHRQETDEKATILKMQIDGLEPGQKYFYQVEAVNDQGEKISTPLYSFSAAPPADPTLTDPAGPAGDEITFAVSADPEARPHIAGRIGKLIWGERPQFWLIPGDLTDGGSRDRKFEWTQEYFTGVGPFAAFIPVMALPGNGDDDLYWYNRYHQVEGKKGYNHFRYGNADFFLLNSNDEAGLAPGGEQYRWVQALLAESTARWKFVSFHHAPWSSDEDDYGDTWRESTTWGDTALRQIIPLLEKYRVDMVFYGHLHCYERSKPLLGEKIDRENGIVYVMCGGAGGNLEDFAPNRPWFAEKLYRGHHYVMIRLSDEQLQLSMYGLEGQLLDVYKKEKNKPYGK